MDMTIWYVETVQLFVENKHSFFISFDTLVEEPYIYMIVGTPTLILTWIYYDIYDLLSHVY